MSKTIVKNAKRFRLKNFCYNILHITLHSILVPHFIKPVVITACHLVTQKVEDTYCGMLSMTVSHWDPYSLSLARQNVAIKCASLDFSYRTYCSNIVIFLRYWLVTRNFKTEIHIFFPVFFNKFDKKLS